jgi:hypothetical protein
LIIGADETMVDLNKAHKNVVDSLAAISVEEMNDKISQIGVMLSHRAAGAIVLPFVILPKLQQIPSDVLSLVRRSEAWVASSTSGWQARETFLSGRQISATGVQDIVNASLIFP